MLKIQLSDIRTIMNFSKLFFTVIDIKCLSDIEHMCMSIMHQYKIFSAILKLLYGAQSSKYMTNYTKIS